MIVEFIVLITTTWIIWFVWDQWKVPKNAPPGPTRFPITGNLIQVIFRNGNKMPSEMFQDFSKDYGPVVSFKLGVLSQVILEDYQIVKDISASEIWVDRYYDEWLARRTFGKPLGLFLGSGTVWREMRRFTVRTLRDFGFGKQKSMEMIIQEELNDLTKSMSQAVNQGDGQSIVNMKQYFTISVLNILWSMIAGTRFSHDNKRLHRLLVLMDGVVRANAVGSILTTFNMAFPILQRVLPKLTSYGQERYEFFKELHQFFWDILKERRSGGIYNEEQRDFIDVFLNEIDVHKINNPEANMYTDEQFIIVCMDLFMAGSETTSNTMEFAILYMILNPDIQNKVQAEIDSVIGTTRFPSILDKPNMPYTEATLCEVQRLASVVPINVRSATEDTTIGEYFIPKGTIGFINIYGIHMNSRVWKKPEIFNPDRFLDKAGSVVNSHKILPFGFGRRVCIGEQLARTTLFTFFTTFLQRFTFEISPDHTPPTMKPALGLTLSPTPYHALVKSRI